MIFFEIVAKRFIEETEPERMSKKESKITISQIAKMANVSTSTVSHVINGTKNVSDRTRLKVEGIINETGYTPNYVAKALKKSETKTIGLIVSDITNQFFVDVIQAVNEEALRNGYMVILGDSDDNPKQELELVKSFQERCIDGLIFSPTIHSGNYAAPYLNSVNLPAVCIDRTLDDKWDWVGTENRNAAKILTRHLIGLGHRRIAFVSGLRGINTTEERIEGYESALKEAGLPFDKTLLIVGESRIVPAKVRSKERFKAILNTENFPTAIIASNNLMVIGIMRTLQELNVKVPEDMALAAFDDFEWADLFQPRITTIVQPCRDIGTKAVQLLIERIKNPTAALQKVEYYPRLEIRESCGILLKDKLKKEGVKKW